MLIHLIAGARPNFMKVAPLYHALERESWCDVRLIHSGQHYDYEMSDIFFEDLGIPAPDVHLGVGSGSHAEQTAGVMVAYEKLCREQCPNLVVVVGDVNSTLACALVAKKLCLFVAHLEAGLRSGDRTMPEEINRIVTDAIADLLWTPSEDADDNLVREGKPRKNIVRVGNIMIDSYEMVREKIEARNEKANLGLADKPYGLVTIHRPVNVDHKENLEAIIGELLKVSKHVPLVFPVHPRTREKFAAHGLLNSMEHSNILMTEPKGYISFMSMMRDANFVLTDSGGIQEETTCLDVPCLTVRETTERPITITHGTNQLVHISDIAASVDAILHGDRRKGEAPDLWDGHTASRVVDSIKHFSGEIRQ